MSRARPVAATLALALLAPAAIAAGAGPARAQQPTRTVAPGKPGTEAPKGKRQIVCRGAAIPKGWILVDDLRDYSQCDGNNPAAVKLYNVWAVEQYEGRSSGTVLTVCAAAPTPAGWTLVDVYRSKELCGHPDELFGLNVKRIRKN
ncbi:MAG: hypothetical protein HYX65_00640 [Gemmatimonadetes bacterium]|nr:hypothetical protein [Gemmatimonadota bacterium]